MRFTSLTCENATCRSSLQPEVDLRGAYSNKNTQVEALDALLRELPDPTYPADNSLKRRKPGRARQPTNDEVGSLIEQYEAGATTQQLADKYGINRRTVSAILHRNDIEPRYHRLTRGQIDDAIRYYQAGWPLARIGERFGVDPTTVLTGYAAEEYPPETLRADRADRSSGSNVIPSTPRGRRFLRSKGGPEVLSDPEQTGATDPVLGTPRRR